MSGKSGAWAEVGRWHRPPVCVVRLKCTHRPGAFNLPAHSERHSTLDSPPRSSRSKPTQALLAREREREGEREGSTGSWRAACSARTCSPPMNRFPMFRSFPTTCEYGSWEGETSKDWTRVGAMNPVGRRCATPAARSAALPNVRSMESSNLQPWT